MVDYKLIGSRLKGFRVTAGLKQENVAERAGITVVYLSKIENGHVRPTLDLLQMICTAVGCDLSSIFCNVSPTTRGYQNERVLDLFHSCSPAVKPIALNLLAELAKLQV